MAKSKVKCKRNKKKSRKGTELDSEKSLSDLREAKSVIAILCSDIHLSMRPPAYRSTEKDWFGAMRGQLLQLCELQEMFDCPVLFSGDLFHNWNAPAELITFAMKYLPSEMYCIPGQHDLPYHNYDLMHKSAYEVLVRSCAIHDLSPSVVMQYTEDFAFVGFPYGYDLINKRNDCLKGSTLIALCHEYKWVEGHSYYDAPKSKIVSAKGTEMQFQKYYGYNIVSYGDNHKSFQTYLATTKIFNCGGFMRRRIDECDYSPRVGLVIRDKNGLNIQSHPLNISNDVYVEPAEKNEAKESDMHEFIKELHRLGDAALDYHQALHCFCEKHKTKPDVKKLILEAIENEQ